MSALADVEAVDAELSVRFRQREEIERQIRLLERTRRVLMAACTPEVRETRTEIRRAETRARRRRQWLQMRTEQQHQQEHRA